MACVIINIGSNLGDRRLHLTRALNRIGARFGQMLISHPVQSQPWGFRSPHPFLNLCAMFHTDLQPLQVLAALQRIERELCPAPHRNPDGTYADRTVDIDILDIDRRVINTPELTLPHPRLPQRRFYLLPLAEIAPAWTHPLSGLTPAQLLALLPPDS